MERRGIRQHHSRARGSWAAAAAAALIASAVVGPAATGIAGEAGGAIPATPPSLAAHYPPSAKEPVHLFAMLGLQDSLSGIVVDLLEGDDAGARAAFAEFQDRYRRAAELVPEWRSAYPEAPVRDLGATLAGEDRAAAMRALETVGGVCHRCHVAAMAPVQLRFRWGNFASQTIRDPLAGDTAPYAEFKRRLATTLTGITRDLRQGQTDNARRQFQAFSGRFVALRESCLACHATPRRAYVDSDVQLLLEELGRALETPAPDPSAVAGLAGRIGRASCSGCHLVHVPAAMAQAQSRESAEAVR